LLLYRDASRNSAAAQATLKEVIAHIPQFFVASQEEINRENVKANDDDEDSMLVGWGKNLSSFRAPAPPPGTLNAKTAVKVMLVCSVIPERERHLCK
jgi:hypothetical protein